MSKITIHPAAGRGKPRQYRAKAFHKITPHENGCRVIIKLAHKTLEFECQDACGDLTNQVLEHY